MAERSSIFDMIGPVMIGPSSSHTAGVVRIGRVARRVLACEPQEVTITFYNSFATTYEGHGSDRAIIGGLMNFATDDERIRTALDIAHERRLKFRFRSVQSASKLHPNSILVQMQGPDGQQAEVLGVSRGGGLIVIEEVDGFHAHFTAQGHTVIVEAQDVPGAISFITGLLRHDHCNIATMTVSRKAKDDVAKHIIELDSAPRPLTLEYMRSVDWMHRVTHFAGVDE
jgi:L-serine dehydratase